MKRAILEWGTIAAIAMSLLIAAGWAMSWLGYDLDSHLKWGRVEVLVEDGAIRATTDSDFDETWSDFVHGIKFRINWIVSHAAWSIPGLEFRWCRWSSGRDDWSVRMSLAIPLASTALAAGYGGIRFRRSARAAADRATSQPGT
jgi:hypothetical protein